MSFLKSSLFICAFLLLQTSADELLAFQRRNIEVLTPRSGQRGTNVSVIMQGLNIKDAREVLFYRPGIKAVAFETLPDLENGISLHHGGYVKEQVRCIFEIAEDCPLGNIHFAFEQKTRSQQWLHFGWGHSLLFPNWNAVVLKSHIAAVIL